MENPPGSTEPIEELIHSLLLHLQIFLEKKDERQIWLAMMGEAVQGILDFYHRSNELFIRFICAIPPRQGTGTRLLYQLAQYGVSHKVQRVKAKVSSSDLRAQQFYFKRLGFRKVGSHFEEPGFELDIAEIQSQTLLKNSSQFSD